MSKVRSATSRLLFDSQTLRWFVSRVWRTRFPVLARLRFKRYIGSLELCRQSSDLCKIDCYPHLFRCSTIKIFKKPFNVSTERPLCCLAFITFTLFSFQGAVPGQRPDQNAQIPLSVLIHSSMVEISGIEPLTSCVQSRRSPG